MVLNIGEMTDIFQKRLEIMSDVCTFKYQNQNNKKFFSFFFISQTKFVDFKTCFFQLKIFKVVQVNIMKVNIDILYQ